MEIHLTLCHQFLPKYLIMILLLYLAKVIFSNNMENQGENYFLQFLKLLSSALVGGTLFFALSALVVIPVYGLDSLLTNGISGSLSDKNFIGALKLMQLFNSVGLFIAAPLVFTWWTKANTRQYLSLEKNPKSLNFILVPILMIVSMPVINWMAEINQQMELPEFLSSMENWMKTKEEEASLITEAFLIMDSIGSLFYNLLLIAIIPAIGEELLFRGTLQQLLSKWTKNIHIAIWISAILFSAMHGQFYGFFPRMLLGSMFGYLLLWSGSLWVPILAHFINNGAAIIIAYFIGSDVLTSQADTFGADQNTLVFTIPAMVIGISLLWTLKKLNQSNTNWTNEISNP
mgnify:CR=1 FL=1